MPKGSDSWSSGAYNIKHVHNNINYEHISSAIRIGCARQARYVHMISLIEHISVDAFTASTHQEPYVQETTENEHINLA
jgi:hypothetical protein